jgi:hypothetical protein
MLDFKRNFTHHSGITREKGVNLMKKQCKTCKSEIDPKATKCPKCGSDQRGWFRRHPILTVILALILIGIIGSMAGSGKGGSKTSQSSSPTPVPQVMKITARQLADDFDSNQVSAETKWKDQLIEFSAEITNITDSGLSFSKVATKDFSLAQISCKIADKNQLLPLKNGQTVTVRGVVGTQTIGVIDVKQCEVIK